MNTSKPIPATQNDTWGFWGATAENFTDLRQRDFDVLPQNIHCQLTRDRYFCRTFLPKQIVHVHAFHLSHDLKNFARRDVFLLRHQISQCHFDKAWSQCGAAQIGIRNNPVQRAFQLADVRLHPPRNTFQNIIRHLSPSPLCLRTQDRETGLQIGRLDIRRESPLKSGTEAFLQRNERLRRAIRRNDDLLILPMQGVERVEKFFLCRFFTGNKLNIVDQQHIN